MTDTNKKNHFIFLNTRAELNFFPQFLVSQKPQAYSLSLCSTWNIEPTAEGKAGWLLLRHSDDAISPYKYFFTLKV